MLKIIIIALISLFLSVTIKSKLPEFSMMISVAGGVLILLFCFDYLSELLSYFSSLSSTVNIDSGIIKTALKVIFVGFLTEFVSDLANDFGNSSIASKVIFGGKVVICLITLPVVKELISLLFSFWFYFLFACVIFKNRIYFVLLRHLKKSLKKNSS